jgi:hypothetical protein
MYKLLKYKYKINSNFDPCSYPGIQCEFYHDALLGTQHGIQPNVDRTVSAANISAANTSNPNVSKVSFMVFRTGSVLIVGKCSEEMLYEIYHFLCNMFEADYDEIKGVSTKMIGKAEKQRKIRKKVILV